MKKILGLPLFGVLFLVFASLYFIYDKEGYIYGNSCLLCKEEKLPYNLKPIHYLDYPQTFYLLDEDELELVGSGFRHRKSSFKIKTFLAYGYNDTSVIVKCTDSLNNIKYLVSYETEYKSKKGNPTISFKDLESSNIGQIKSNYQWTEIDEEKARAIERNKLLFMLGALLSLVLLLIKLFKFIKAKALK